MVFAIRNQGILPVSFCDSADHASHDYDVDDDDDDDDDDDANSDRHVLMLVFAI